MTATTTGAPVPAAPEPSAPLGLGDIIRLNDQFHDAALLHLAVAARLFDLAGEPVTAGDVAAARGWVERKTRILLDALAAAGLLTKDGDHYRNAPVADRHLTSAGEAYVGAIVDHQRLQWELWGRMDDVLAAEQPVPAQQELRLRRDRDANEAFQAAMVQLSRDNLADVLAVPDFATAGRVLDLCGGHGTYLASLADRHPGLTGEVWDLEPARAMAERTFREHGTGDRLRFRARDVRDPGAFAGETADACMLNDCLHYFDAGEARALIERAAGVLTPGGMVLVLTMTLDDERTTPAAAAGFSLHMMLNTSKGELHPTPAIVRAMAGAGLAVTRHSLGSLGRYSLLAGRAPGPGADRP